MRVIRIGIPLAVTIVFAWLVMPNLITARNRSRQQRTLSDLRTIATAWEARATDVNSYSVKRVSNGRVTTDDLVQALQPTYVRHFPRVDGWGNQYELSVREPDESGRAQVYEIHSLGSDGRRDLHTSPGGPTTNFADDIIYSNGSFVQYPEGVG